MSSLKLLGLNDDQDRITNAKTYSMRELNQHTARVLDEVNDSKQPAVITKHGRFIALITPLRDAPLESLILAQGAVADEMYQRATQPGPTTTSAELAEKIKRHYRDG